MSFPSKDFICVFRIFSATTFPLMLSSSTISPTRKGRLKARIIPDKKFSPISLNAKPKITALMLAPVSRPPAIPASPITFITTIKAKRTMAIFTILLRKAASKGSSIRSVSFRLAIFRLWLAINNKT